MKMATLHRLSGAPEVHLNKKQTHEFDVEDESKGNQQKSVLPTSVSSMKMATLHRLSKAGRPEVYVKMMKKQTSELMSKKIIPTLPEIYGTTTAPAEVSLHNHVSPAHEKDNFASLI